MIDKVADRYTLDEVVNWLIRQGVRLMDVEYLIDHPGDWLPFPGGRVRYFQENGMHHAEIESKEER